LYLLLRFLCSLLVGQSVEIPLYTGRVVAPHRHYIGYVELPNSALLAGPNPSSLNVGPERRTVHAAAMEKSQSPMLSDPLAATTFSPFGGSLVDGSLGETPSVVLQSPRITVVHGSNFFAVCRF
jgi:hypothetical protein